MGNGIAARQLKTAYDIIASHFQGAWGSAEKDRRQSNYGTSQSPAHRMGAACAE